MQAILDPYAPMTVIHDARERMAIRIAHARYLHKVDIHVYCYRAFPH